MMILVLNGSPRPKGNTVAMVEAFREGAASAGHQAEVVDVCRKKIGGCLACEHCHAKGGGACIQKDDMQEVNALLNQAEMLVIASPIYCQISGQLKCTIDRFYAAAYPTKPPHLSKVAMILSSGDRDMYDCALFSFRGDFLEYLGLEDMGAFTAYGAQNKPKDCTVNLFSNFPLRQANLIKDPEYNKNVHSEFEIAKASIARSIKR